MPRVSALNQLASPRGTTSDLQTSWRLKLAEAMARQRALAAQTDYTQAQTADIARRGTASADLLALERERLQAERELGSEQLGLQRELGRGDLDLQGQKLAQSAREAEGLERFRQAGLDETSRAARAGEALASRQFGLQERQVESQLSDPRRRVMDALAARLTSDGGAISQMKAQAALQAFGLRGEDPQSKLRPLYEQLLPKALAAGDTEAVKSILGRIAGDQVPSGAISELTKLTGRLGRPEWVSERVMRNLTADIRPLSDALDDMLSWHNVITADDYRHVGNAARRAVRQLKEHGATKPEIIQSLEELLNTKLEPYSRWWSGDEADTALREQIRERVMEGLQGLIWE